MELDRPLTSLTGCGAKRAQQYHAAGIRTVRELAMHPPTPEATSLPSWESLRAQAQELIRGTELKTQAFEDFSWAGLVLHVLVPLEGKPPSLHRAQVVALVCDGNSVSVAMRRTDNGRMLGNDPRALVHIHHMWLARQAVSDDSESDGEVEKDVTTKCRRRTLSPDSKPLPKLAVRGRPLDTLPRHVARAAREVNALLDI